MYTPNEIEIDEAIEEALDGKPRSLEIAEMVAALHVRRNLFQQELNIALEENSEKRVKEWKRKLKDTEQQIRVLSEEMAITDFVERSVIAISKQTGPGVYD